ncbi:TOPRS ligase, partial [Nyctibius bracteatus]|nr:TOPRS ligase [Nyctibius bracteatus]
MAAEEEWICPICRDVRDDVAYALPCLHQFCLSCILGWAKRKAECPVCRGLIERVKYSVHEEDSYIETTSTDPAESQDASTQTDTTPGHLADNSPHGPMVSLPSSWLRMPSPAEQGAVGTDASVAVDGLLPEVWAELFQRQEHLLDPVLPWLRRELEATYGAQWWLKKHAESIILHALCVHGPDREVMVQVLQPTFGEFTAALVRGIINIIACQCSEEAQRLLPSWAAGKEDDSPAASSSPTSSSNTSSRAGPPDSILASPSSPEGPDVEEEAGTSQAKLHGGPSHPPSALAGPSVPGCSCRSSAASRGRRCLPRGPRRPTKRRASSTQDSPQPCKRPCPVAS